MVEDLIKFDKIKKKLNMGIFDKTASNYHIVILLILISLLMLSTYMLGSEVASFVSTFLLSFSLSMLFLVNFEKNALLTFIDAVYYSSLMGSILTMFINLVFLLLISPFTVVEYPVFGLICITLFSVCSFLNHQGLTENTKLDKSEVLIFEKQEKDLKNKILKKIKTIDDAAYGIDICTENDLNDSLPIVKEKLNVLLKKHKFKSLAEYRIKNRQFIEKNNLMENI